MRDPRVPIFLDPASRSYLFRSWSSNGRLIWTLLDDIRAVALLMLEILERYTPRIRRLLISELIDTLDAMLWEELQREEPHAAERVPLEDYLRQRPRFIGVRQYLFAAIDHLDRAVEMARHIECDFRAASAAWVDDDASRAVREYIAALDVMTAGNFRFHQTTPRYHGPGFTGVFAGRRVVCQVSDAESL